MTQTHSFHIPVMGISFTLDTPLKVSHLGIDSVVSLVDDILLEKLRKMYCHTYQIPYSEIKDTDDDFRAKRITSYLDLINNLAREKFEKLKSSAIEKSNDFKEYFNLLPDNSKIKQELNRLLESNINVSDIKTWLIENLAMGSIDVNIMTKVDKTNFNQKKELPVEYNDAHSALRGYANSTLSSSLVLSAGMNPRLYGYLENFQDFFPDEKGFIKKKIILKVSDYRSAYIQGTYLAKKGLWVSEYRIESGLNCGGHAFATDGYLLGPVLDEFKEKRTELTTSLNTILSNALCTKGFKQPTAPLMFKVTAQGGVGTAEEHRLLLEHYKLDSVGWGTPFLLVPEVSTVDEPTLQKLIKAKEKDLYLSRTSPLGIPFNTLVNNSQDIEKLKLIEKGRPGSSCPKKFLALNTEFTDKAICTASRQYQYLKLKDLESKNLSANKLKIEKQKITDKSCICVGLGSSSLIVNNITTRAKEDGVSICPGPNMAYFSNKYSLREMTDHIYGRSNIIRRSDRPNMFIKELNIYIEYLRNQINETNETLTKKQKKALQRFVMNLEKGINYYQSLFSSLKNSFTDLRSRIFQDLENGKEMLDGLSNEINALNTIDSCNATQMEV